MSWNLHQCCKDNFLKAMSKARIRLSQPLRKWATEMKCKRAAALKPSQLKRALDMHGAPTSGSSLPLAGVSVAKRRRLATSNEMTIRELYSSECLVDSGIPLTPPDVVNFVYQGLLDVYNQLELAGLSGVFDKQLDFVLLLCLFIAIDLILVVSCW